MKYSKYNSYLDFIKEYSKASNAATGSKFDANANVESKNVATLSTEMHKEANIGINRLQMFNKIYQMWGEDLAYEYIRQLESHELYKHDETHPCAPYTYSAKEVVYVKTPYGNKLISFEDLYDLCNSEEFLVDEEKEVYCKYPKSGEYQILDKDGFTNISRLVKKQRHRDLVRVKTAFGEDLIVTDNHPLIISEDVNDTIDAEKSLNESQLRVKTNIEFLGKEEEDISCFPYTIQKFGNYHVSQPSQQATYAFLKNVVKMDRELGYVIGFFIGDGNYVANVDGSIQYISFTQKERATLDRIAEIIYEHFGIGGTIRYRDDVSNCWSLQIRSIEIVYLFHTILGINHYAQHKTLPTNIFDYNKDFALGIIEGLIDSDGTVCCDRSSVSIRLSSRTAIMQLSMLMHSMGFTGGNGYQNAPFSNNKKIKTNYSIFAFQFSVRENDFVELQGSYKVRQILNLSNGGQKYTYGWSKITQVTKVDNGSFLDDNYYIYDITTDSHSFICNGLWCHNCAAISMYPFLFDGLKSIGGPSTAPKNLNSFCGNFVNLVFAVSSQFAGAIATPEFLPYMDYFIRKEYGDDYYLDTSVVVVNSKTRPRTLKQYIEDCFEQVVYSINEPAAARNFQSVFWNISYFDKGYFTSIFEDFVFPDGTLPQWESTSWLQKCFMSWFNKERTRNYLTFPVETVNLLYDKETKKYSDDDWYEFTAKMWANGHSFFCYNSDSADALSSCCRLKSELNDDVFSYTLGAGGISTGSKSVITININRLVQDAKKNGEDVGDRIREQVRKIHKYQLSYNAILEEELKDGLMPVYDAGYISLKKQYLTIGINGLVEGAEFLGIKVGDNQEYFDYCESILKPIYEENKRARKEYDWMFNTEYVPAENLGVKNAQWDRKSGYFVPRDCYNSYFFIVEDDSLSIMDKMILHGDKVVKYLDGGSACHINLEEHLDEEQYKKLLDFAAQVGCSYFTFNVPNMVCNECNHISKHYLKKCPKCGSTNLDYITRVIGYAKRVSNYSEARQQEEHRRFYGKC